MKKLINITLLFCLSIMVFGCSMDRSRRSSHMISCDLVTPKLSPEIFRCENREIIFYIYIDGTVFHTQKK